MRLNIFHNFCFAKMRVASYMVRDRGKYSHIFFNENNTKIKKKKATKVIAPLERGAIFPGLEATLN